MKKITIELSDEIINQINTITTYENAKNTMKHNGRSNQFTTEDFVIGCIHFYLDEIDNYNQLIAGEGKLKNNLKQIMESKNLKQKQLAELTHIDPGNLNATLSNRYQLTLDNFLRIWNALGRPPIIECFYREN